MYSKKPEVFNWETPNESLFDELKTVKVIDNTGAHFVKEKELKRYFNQQIDDWFFGGDSMGTEFVLGDDSSDDWMW